jgi:2-polyprenyl-3-methyl-5-hydroxy-6-metoxy-1,4-benzoquinol methylase
MTTPKSTTDRCCWVHEWKEMRGAKGWWHSFELPDGTRIDGVHEVPVLKQRIAQFPIPENLQGRRVLDIGAWDGWFSFEMERRGAEVMAIDNWDNPRFRQIHGVLDSRVEYRQLDMYQLTPDRIGRFDIVLFMGVLYHLKHPLLALERVCALTTGMAAVESFVLRDRHRPDEDVEKVPVMEFYETDEFGGQTDNWIGPSLPCLLALCRTAGFARVELQRATDYGVAVACYRKWESPASHGGNAPTLIRVEHNTKPAIHFDSHADEYVSAWLTCGENNLDLNRVKPDVGGYGVRPIFVGHAEDGSWQANFKLPPGLEPGWHEVTVRLDTGPASNAKRIAVDLPVEDSAVLSSSRTAGEAQTLDRKPMNVQKVVSEIHARIRKEENPESRSSQDSYELAALRSVYERLYLNRNAVGKMPPSPDTLRAKIGAYLVRVVQRCLFWYTPQILQFQNDAISAFDSVCDLLSRQSERTAALGRDVHKLRREILDNTCDLISRQSERIASLEQELHELRREVANLKVRPDTGNVEPGLPNAFQFALQDRFRGSETDAAGKLQIYLETLKPLLPTLPRAQWLDIGCGRGEWIEAVSKLGYRVLGLDSNLASVLHCREKHLNVEERDALSYLRTLGDASVAVITAFHVVEHWPIHYLLALVEEVVRVLQPGGLLIIETPNPANLLIESTSFWNDPTHHRPIPMRLLEFVYEYFELTVMKRLELNPFPQDHRFAFDELSVVHRLNDYFYGPQDYALIGRR